MNFLCRIQRQWQFIEMKILEDAFVVGQHHPFLLFSCLLKTNSNSSIFYLVVILFCFVILLANKLPKLKWQISVRCACDLDSNSLANIDPFLHLITPVNIVIRVLLPTAYKTMIQHYSRPHNIAYKIYNTLNA